MDLDVVEITENSQPSVNFGGGIELLMNDKVKGSGESSNGGDINLDDLDDLEDKLKVPDSNGESSSLYKNIDNVRPITPSINKVSFGESHNPPSPPPVNNSESFTSVGKQTALDDGADSSNKTWDGFSKFNNIPINPDVSRRPVPEKTKEEILREKFEYLRKLEALEKKGVQLSKHYTMESSLSEMQGEYETIKSEAEKKNSVKFQGKMLMAAVTGLEFLNSKFDPFDFHLDGWAEQVSENLDDYDEIFGELHEKYRSKATMAPELKLMFQLGGSAVMLHMTNSMFKNSMPGMDDIMKQNPDLMRQFTQAAVNQMDDTAPGFSNFMNMVNDDQQPAARPPSPIRTKNLNMGRDEAVSSRKGRGLDTDGISLGGGFEEVREKPEKSSRTRPDMSGPDDITNLLSNLKTTTNNKTSNGLTVDDTSTVSIQELKTMQGDMSNGPTKSKRRGKSDKNTISLDI